MTRLFSTKNFVNILPFLILVSVHGLVFAQGVSEEKPFVTIDISNNIVQGVCRHSNLTSYVIFPCSSRDNCDHIVQCLESGDATKTCGEPLLGEPCTGENQNGVKCSTFFMHRINEFAAIAHCKGFSGKIQRETIEPLIRTTDFKWQTGKNTRSLMTFRVNQTIKIFHHKKPLLYIGEQVSIGCRVSRYFFPDNIQLVGIFRNGTKFQIARKKVDSTLVYLDIDSSFKILKDMVKISCLTSWYNATSGWFRKVLEFNTVEPSIPTMEKTKQMKFHNCNEFQKLTFRFTGGPLTMSKCFFKAQTSTELKDETILGHQIKHHAYGEVSSIVLNSDSLKRGVGTYSCYLGNQFGTQSSQIHVDILGVYGSQDAISVFEDQLKNPGRQQTQRHENQICKNGYALEKQSGQCYEVGSKGPCRDDMMAFNKISLNNNYELLEGECGCRNFLSTKKCQSNRIVYWKDDGHCYRLHSRGPCKPFNYLKMDELGNVVCNRDDTEDRSISFVGDTPCPPNTKEDDAGNCIDHVEFE